MSEIRLNPISAEERERRAEERAQADGRGLPCYHWCMLCLSIPGDDPCHDCPDCNHSLSAADDATWD